MIEMKCKVMFLMYEDIKLVEFTEVVDNVYIASGSLFGMEDGETIESFFKSKCYDWTGGYDFGNRIWIGDLEDNRGNMLVVFNNDNGNVEWIDSEYGCFGSLEEDPNGILASSIDELIKILDDNTINQYE